MKQKKWLISICALAGLLVLCVGVYIVLDPDRGDISGAPVEAPAKPEGPGPTDSAQPGAYLPDDVGLGQLERRGGLLSCCPERRQAGGQQCAASTRLSF